MYASRRWYLNGQVENTHPFRWWVKFRGKWMVCATRRRCGQRQCGLVTTTHSRLEDDLMRQVISCNSVQYNLQREDGLQNAFG